MLEVAYLEGRELDYWVARAAGWITLRFKPGTDELYGRPSITAEGVERVPDYTQWSAAGPIIAEQKIASEPYGAHCWRARITEGRLAESKPYIGMTPIEAAMRCYVGAVFGAEVNDCPPFIGKETCSSMLRKVRFDLQDCGRVRDAWV